MTKIRASTFSRYIRTTWKLSAGNALKIPAIDAGIRHLSKVEATSLADRAERSNPFIRRPYGNLFYPTRIRNLADRTVIEIFKDGQPAELGSSLHSLALLIEATVLLSSTLNTTRPQFHKLLAIDKDKGGDYDIVIGPRFKSFRSRSKRERLPTGIPIDNRFIKRFNSNGFPALLHYCQSSTDLSQKLHRSLQWLQDSRNDPIFHAAIVKTSIALESLLIFNDSDPLARSLSQRIAFLLSTKPETRARLSSIVRNFYGARSAIVHGGRKKAERISPSLLEATDCLVLLCCLVIAANQSRWPTKDALRDWCDAQQWASPDLQITIPFSERHLNAAVKKAITG